MFQPFLNAVWIFEGYNFAQREAAVVKSRVSVNWEQIQ